MISRNILILEDDATFLRVLNGRIKMFYPDATIFTFESMDKTREFLETNQRIFDLVLLDHYLPDGYGIELLREKRFEEMAVLVISSDDTPEMPGACLSAGAAYFLNKNELSSELFFPLVRGLIERNKLQRELSEAKLEETRLDTIRKIVHNLKHEVNNPLGAVLGATYLMKGLDSNSDKYHEAAQLIEQSSLRIKKVIEELCLLVENPKKLENEFTSN